MLAVFARHFQIRKRIAQSSKDVCPHAWKLLFFGKPKHSQARISADDFGHRFFSDYAAIPGSDGHVLDVMRGISNHAALYAVAQIEVKKDFAGLRVERVKKTANFAGENQI